MELFKNGVPCSHPGCLNHITHPCEVCGRFGARTTDGFRVKEILRICTNWHNGDLATDTVMSLIEDIMNGRDA
jgi:hypothetical protein